MLLLMLMLTAKDTRQYVGSSLNENEEFGL
jgi:hypothetical protein